MKYQKKVKDVMLPISTYPTVHISGTLLDAVRSLENAQKHRSSEIEPYRAVLVVDDEGKIIGKIGHLSFLKALEPKYNILIDIDKLTQVNLSSEFIETIMDHYDLWRDNFFDICAKAHNIYIKDIMMPIIQNISQEASIAEAVHKIIMWQTLSILVTDGSKIVGILRLSDLYKEVANFLLNECECAKNYKE